MTTGDIVAPGFSLRASLKARGCHGDVRATPLSLTGELLSVNVTGTLCGRDYTFMEVFSLAGKAVPKLSELFGERTVVSTLKRDPYLNAVSSLRGSTVTELEQSLTGQPPRGDCPLAPSPLSVAERSYAIWNTAGQQVNVRLALPVRCGGTEVNNYVWLGLMLPGSALKERVAFDFTNRPRTVAHIRW
ncbi:hypothetical protein [Deinococcus radiophilus]|uniref:Uncharacterized protein n=2 Tax=Deinococcus radiophilus TaxID=32062 RepID=A0A3S0KED7_9DEIO|nr:hypothetical protein [Deinococcus radiophilus]RTR28694.1 hypothetical protein EJ104_04895 [Deinococcus radiophilus]UFA51117.1 hypothetical protein LMT64_04255 [Deinococcus radiophilus]